MSAASAIDMNVFGLNPVVVFGTKEQCGRMLPGIVDGTKSPASQLPNPIPN
jgi:acyl-CoA dehydrogenase